MIHKIFVISVLVMFMSGCLFSGSSDRYVKYLKCVNKIHPKNSADYPKDETKYYCSKKAKYTLTQSDLEDWY